jgi:ABC-2 type transport system permease protein
MVFRIARKEITELSRDGRVRTAGAIVLVLLCAALGAGWKQYRDVRHQHDVAQRATREQWLRQTPKNPHSAAHYGVYAFKPVSRLSLVDTGVDPYVGVAAWLEAHKQNEFRYRPAQDRTALQRFGELTAAQVLQVLLPLLIMLLAFAAFAGEREAGTLRQIVSLGVPAQRLLLGKALGLATTLGVLLLPATILGAAILVFSGTQEALNADIGRVWLLSGAYLLYAGTFLALALGISAVAASSRQALLILLALWMVNCLIVPRVAADVSGALAPTPSAVEFQTALEKDLNDAAGLERTLDERRAELLRQYGVTSVDALPVNFSGISLQAGEEHGNEVFDRHYAALFDRFDRQNRLVQIGGLLSPGLAMSALSMGLAGTDFGQHRDFVRAAEQYRRGIQRVMNDDIARHARPGAAYLAGQELWARVPPFAYQRPGVGWVLARQWPGALALVAWFVLAWGFALGAVRRQPV